MADLGALPAYPCSLAAAVNSQAQVVGQSFSCSGPFVTHAFLWENGAIFDLNALVRSGSGIQLLDAVNINDRGEIVGDGLLPNAHSHAVLLIPCDENHPNIEGCDYSMVEESADVPGANLPAGSPGLSASAIMQLLRSINLRPTQWRRKFGALPHK